MQAATRVVFDEVYNYNELQIGCALLPILGGLTSGGLVAGKLIDRNYEITARMYNMNDTKRTEQDFLIESARYRHYMPFIVAEVLLIAGYGWLQY